MLHLYIGDGKGKTTAAMGQAIRAAGAGQSVLIAQFLKDGSSSELRVLEKLDKIYIMSLSEKLGFTFKMDGNKFEDAKGKWEGYFESVCSKLSEADKFHMLVLDELLDAVNVGMIDEADAYRLIDCHINKVEIIITGRNPKAGFEKRADYITEMRKIRHPFDNGIVARKGIEY